MTALALDCCSLAIRRAQRTRQPQHCACGAEYVPKSFEHERALEQLRRDADAMARWAPYYQGSAMDVDRTRRAPSALLTDDEREARDARTEQQRAAARPLFVRLEALRAEAARTRGPELVRAVAVIDWLIGHCGSERTKGVRVGSEVRAPKLPRLCGEAFADEATKRRATPPPRVRPQAPSDEPPKPPPPLTLSPVPSPAATEREIVEAHAVRAQERLAHRTVTGRYVVEVLVWLLRRALHERALQAAKDATDDADGARAAIERHGVELLQDAAWLWSATSSGEVIEQPLSFEQICAALTARIEAERERRRREREAMER